MSEAFTNARWKTIVPILREMGSVLHQRGHHGQAEVTEGLVRLAAENGDAFLERL